MENDQIHDLCWLEPRLLTIIPRRTLQEGDWFIYSSENKFRRLMLRGEEWIAYDIQGLRRATQYNLDNLLSECGYNSHLRILEPVTRETYLARFVHNRNNTDD